MKIPLNVLDFLHRADAAYGDRIGIVDEPNQPASSWGSVTWRRAAELARAQAAGLDALGVGFGERVAIISQNSARTFVSHVRRAGLRPHDRAHQLPARAPTRSATSWSTRGPRWS